MSRGGGRGYLVAEKGISICVVFRGGLRYNQNMRIASINTKDGGIQMFQFFMQFLKHPKTIGAFAPSGRALAEKMMEPVSFARARCIVEYGPGTGSFTRELLRRRRAHTTLLIIEQNEVFYQKLRKELEGEQDVYVIHGSAEQVNAYLPAYGFETADYILSGLPFTSLPKAVSERILEATQKALGEKGRFITFQYSLAKQSFFQEYFTFTGRLLEFKNIPPAYVMVMKNKTGVFSKKK